MIKIYTDGSCIGNPGRGGWAAIILNDGPWVDAAHFSVITLIKIGYGNFLTQTTFD